MDNLVHWKLLDEMNPRQAALLMLGLDPSRFSFEMDSRPKSQPNGYLACVTAIKNAIISERIKARISYYEHSDYGEDAVHWDGTLLEVESLKSWLNEKQTQDSFFNTGNGIFEFSFMDENHPHYSPKMAATVSAWLAVNERPELLNGKTPKQAVEKWLRENASQFDLTKDDGKLNESAISEICKIVNWNPQGGVAKTPTQVPANPTTPLTIIKPENFIEPVEEEIPF